MKKSKAIVILIVILGALAGLAYYASIILSSTGIGEEMSIPLGLDLSGGVSITYQVVDDNPSAEDMSDTIYKLQKRVEGYSTEASVYQVGDDRITVEIIGIRYTRDLNRNSVVSNLIYGSFCTVTVYTFLKFINGITHIFSTWILVHYLISNGNTTGEIQSQRN